MSLARRVGFAGATFVTAWAAGFVMQNGDALASKFGFNSAAVDLPPLAHPVRIAAMGRPTSDEFNVILGQAMIAERSLMARKPGQLSIETRNVVVANQPELVAEYRIALLGEWPDLGAEEFALSDVTAEPADCTVSLRAEKQGAALVALSLNAPCRRDERVTIEHESMSFTELTSPDGQLEITVPALVENAEFYAFFSDDEGAVADAVVPEIADFDRVVVLWSGSAGLQIHAREMGAEYGEEGHVWSGSPMTPANAQMARGGFITTLGNSSAVAPKMGEVYTFPKAAISGSDAVDLTIEAEISALNCGRNISALSLQSNGDAPATMLELDLSVPTCDAVGDLVMLDSLVADLRAAGH